MTVVKKDSKSSLRLVNNFYELIIVVFTFLLNLTMKRVGLLSLPVSIYGGLL